jgi:hypothetical protein
MFDCRRVYQAMKNMVSGFKYVERCSNQKALFREFLTIPTSNGLTKTVGFDFG